MAAEKGTVCVTGGTGFVGSWLIYRLLDHGYTVKTTVRSDPDNKRDLSFLTSLQGASERLQIFHADLSNPESFEAAIEGCTGVFHVATPLDFQDREPEEIVTKRSINGTLGILKACLNSKTVKRVVYTSSAAAAQFPSNTEEIDEVDESIWSDEDYVKVHKPYGGSYLISSQWKQPVVFLASPVEGSGRNNDLLADRGPLLSFINGAWVDLRFKLKPSFEGIVKRSYRAQLENVDFLNKAEEVLEEVNFWAGNASNGLIKEFLPSGSLNSETALVLANALYFKGTWDHEFDPSMTQLRDFHVLKSQSFIVPFMTTKRNVNHLYGSFDGYKVVQIPYKSGQDSSRFSMYFFLPNENGLPNLIQTLKFKSDFFHQQFKLRKVHLSEFWIPKFKFSFKFEASETMKEMGLKLPFTDGEVTEMVDCLNSDKLYVSNIFHQSHIEVNEEGTEVVASSAFIQQFRSGYVYLNSSSFVADHPFLFMIREEKSRMVFFVGAVLKPLLDA